MSAVVVKLRADRCAASRVTSENQTGPFAGWTRLLEFGIRMGIGLRVGVARILTGESPPIFC